MFKELLKCIVKVAVCGSKCGRINFIEPLIIFLEVCKSIVKPELSGVLLAALMHLLAKLQSLVIHKADTAESLGHQDLLLRCGIYSVSVASLHIFVSVYFSAKIRKIFHIRKFIIVHFINKC